ncbi:carotenoid biosynthesis protein [Sphaerisporangium sp. TRM90804]|uniref:carotenoid biosynthesis protein n=1 Tax=Sphaerisporangium sp. TRM90804 TaxID=3031113 RepID=UPI00244A1BF2|nr:carotenoid biosynthesis protein [Sphaerisporangium sp. TRM90804]MDH2429649.1 carotenoid biosynthesis protein [Sphaerisporangium sp. TRM90804]
MRAPAARRAFLVAGTVALGAMIVAQVLSGLEPAPVRLTSVVVLLLAAAAVAYAAAAHTSPRAVAAFAGTVVVGYAAEWVGIRTGFPFGEYRYTGLLWPELGGVPVIVAVAWGGMGLASYAVASAVARGTTSRIVVGALALTSWDLFLDPQMIRLGLWAWAEPGPYRGVPVSNFAGWLLVSVLVMALIGKILTNPGHAAPGLVALYTVMAVMETIGFAAVFTPPDPLVATAGGACMGTLAFLAWRRRWTS